MIGRENAAAKADRRKRSWGLTLLNLSAWVRRQNWLRAVYKYLPASLRMAASQALAKPAGQQVKFTRTARWKCGGARVTISAHPTNGAGYSNEADGVNIFAYVRGQFGLAESARLYTRALLENGHPVAVHDIALDLAHSMGDASLDAHIGCETPHEVNLVFVNPDYLDAARAAIGPEKLAGRYTIGCWFWELENFPREWLPALACVDEILVSSAFVRDLVSRVTNKPILHVPLPVLEVPDSGLVRADFGLKDDAYVFLTSFDFNSFMARKNPLAVIRAFRQAFDPGEEHVELLIKASNGHRHPERLRELMNAAAGDPRILVRDEIIEREHVQALQRCADAYVSLHRAEGFGLGLAECMRMGKPVIATGWSGNMEFMTPENSCLVGSKLIAVREGEYLFSEGQRWADPDVEQAAAYMRRLVDEPIFGQQIGERASADIRRNLSAAVVAQQLADRLAEIHLNRLGRRESPMPETHS